MKRIFCIGVIFFTHYNFCMQEAPAAAAAGRVIKLLASDGQVECPIELALQSPVIKRKLEFQQAAAQAVEDEFELRDFSQKELLRCVDYLEKCADQASLVQAYPGEDLSTNIRMLTLADFLDIESLRTAEVKEVGGKLSLLKNLYQFEDKPSLIESLLSIPDVDTQAIAQRLPIVYFSIVASSTDSTDPVFTPYGKIKVVYNRGTYRLLNIATGAELYRVEGDNYRPVFSPDGRILAVHNDWNHICRIFDVARKAELYQVKGVTPLFSPDGRILAVFKNVFQDERWCLLLATTGEELCRIPGGQSATFSPNGRTLAVNRKNKEWCFFDVATGEELFKEPGNQEQIPVFYRDLLGEDEKELSLQQKVFLHLLAKVQWVKRELDLTDIKNWPFLEVFAQFNPKTQEILEKNFKIEVDEVIPIEQQAAIDAQDAEGRSVLYRAVLHNEPDLVKSLLARGVNVNGRVTYRRISPEYGYTPLHIAAKNKHELLAECLMEHGADVHAKDANGWAPLHIAAMQNLLHMVVVLSKHGAYIDERTKQQETPLHIALDNKHESLAMSLVLYGADIHARDSKDWSCFDYAVARDIPAVRDELVRRGCNAFEAEKQ